VISPLVSLMDDQVMGLVNLGLNAKMFTADTPKEETKAIYAEMLNHRGGPIVSPFRFHYVAPCRHALPTSPN